MLLTRGMTDIIAKMRKDLVEADPNAYLSSLPKELGLDSYSRLLEFEVVHFFFFGGFMTPPRVIERAYVVLGTGLVLKLEEEMGTIVYARFLSYAEALNTPLGYDVGQRPLRVIQLSPDDLARFKK